VIQALSEWVMRTATKQCAEWRRTGLRLSVAIFGLEELDAVLEDPGNLHVR
jgi:EAL domain-containing protein (putative c-di-GMP-specific phosphodiesterase class I)